LRDHPKVATEIGLEIPDTRPDVAFEQSTGLKRLTLEEKRDLLLKLLEGCGCSTDDGAEPPSDSAPPTEEGQ
jgi:hypothetical protein